MDFNGPIKKWNLTCLESTFMMKELRQFKKKTFIKDFYDYFFPILIAISAILTVKHFMLTGYWRKISENR